MIFRYPVINPIRLVKQEVDLDKYWNKPFDLLQPDKCYHQPFTTLDTTTLQFLSEYDIATNELDFKVYNAETEVFVTSITPVLKTINIIGQPFDAYEINIDFSAFPEGLYYAELTYTDENIQPVVYQSEVIDVKEEHPNTILIEYKNSENDFEAIFETGIEFSLRIPGVIADFQPEFDDVIYNDQKRNVTKLHSVPYRTFKLYVSDDAAGVPDWFIDIINQSFSCDQIMLDGQYFEKSEGAKWEAKRAEPEYPFTGWQIEIVPVENILFKRLKTGDEPPLGFTVVEKVKNYMSNAANLTVSGIFRKYSLLKNVTIYNYGSAFTLNIGTTDGGDEIGSFPVEANADLNLSLNVVFRSAATIYLTGLTGTTTDILFDYLQYDELPAGGAVNINNLDYVQIGTVMIYEEPTPGDLALDFNLGTGLGVANGRYENYAICDGRNGTIDRGALFPVGYKLDDVDYGTIGDTGGLASVTLTEAQLPVITVEVPIQTTGGDWRTSGGSGSPKIDGGNTNATPFGGGDSHENRPPFIVSLWIKKIQ